MHQDGRVTELFTMQYATQVTSYYDATTIITYHKKMKTMSTEQKFDHTTSSYYAA